MVFPFLYLLIADSVSACLQEQRRCHNIDWPEVYSTLPKRAYYVYKPEFMPTKKAAQLPDSLCFPDASEF